jgi:putative transposase
MAKRTFTEEQKLEILNEAKEKGVKKTLDDHGIYAGMYYSWKEKYEANGKEGLANRVTAPQLKRIRELEKENLELKQMLAESALTQRMKDKLVKKKIFLK